MLEIDRLAEMLTEAHIPFQRDDEDYRPRGMSFYMYRIAYPKIEIFGNEIYKAISVIQGNGSKGNESNLLEICHGLNFEPKGYITAEEAFACIKEDWSNRAGK